MHRTTEPPILYFGTPVVLISTENEDGSYNIGPMSSAFWLGWRCVLGLSAVSKSPENMWRTGEAVLNLPSDEMVAAVDRLARKTGSDPVPAVKDRRGYTTERDKFGLAGLTPMPAHQSRRLLLGGAAGRDADPRDRGRVHLQLLPRLLHPGHHRRAVAGQ